MRERDGFTLRTLEEQSLRTAIVGLSGLAVTPPTAHLAPTLLDELITGRCEVGWWGLWHGETECTECCLLNNSVYYVSFYTIPIQSQFSFKSLFSFSLINSLVLWFLWIFAFLLSYNNAYLLTYIFYCMICAFLIFRYVICDALLLLNPIKYF